MSSARLTDIQVGAIKCVRRAPTTLNIPAPTAVTTEPIANIPEYELIRSIPGIEYYLLPDYIPDLIYMLKSDGVKDFINSLTEESARKREIFKTYQEQGWEGFLILMSSIMLPNIITQNVYNFGRLALQQHVANCDPTDPSTIIFRHRSQEIHVATQKVEMDIIKNEPEVVEREDIQCSCGSRKVKTTQKQTRSADEPATVRAMCVTCKKSWQFSAA